MKKAYYIVVTLCLALIVCSSCMKKDDVTLVPDCAITSFGMGTITSYVNVKNEKGEDVTVKRTIYAGEYHFSINQIPNEKGQCVIENKDSMPNWVSLQRIQPRFSAFGNVSIKNPDGSFVGIISEGDSLNFTNGLTLRVSSTDEAYSKEYVVKVNKYSSPTDTVTWKRVDDANLQLATDAYRTLSCSGIGADATTAENRAYVFTLNDAGKPQVTSSVNGNSWEAPAEFVDNNGTAINVNINSIVTHVVTEEIDGAKSSKMQLFALSADGKLYVSDNSSKGRTWTKKADTNLNMLLGSDGLYLYGFNGTAIVGTTEFNTWVVSGSDELNKLPTSYTRMFSHESPVNSKMRNATLVGQCDADNDNTIAWYKVSSLTAAYNQPWAYMRVTKENSYALPKLLDLSVVQHKSALYAIGRTQNEGSYAMSSFYESFDNGMSWYKKAYKWVLPADLNANDGAVNLISVGDTLWAVQKGGKVWRASIR